MFQQLFIGLTDGTTYAIIGLALSLVNRVSGTVNFAQGEMATLGAFLSYTAINSLGWDWELAFAFGIVISLVIGAVLQLILVRPVARQQGFGLLLLTIGLFYLINGITGQVWGYTTRNFYSPFSSAPKQFWGIVLTERQVATLVITLALALLCAVLLRYTSFGLALRAASRQPVESQLLGISVLRVQAVGWALAAGLGTVAGLLVAPIQFLQPNMMQPPLLFAFAAIVLGGVNSLLGGVVGGLLIGVILALATYLVPSLGTLTPVIAFAIIIAVLYVRPNGLFGREAISRA